ncbi:unnamed protein product [Schistocephalus solidus]|uniref:RT_RNaseH_2 domain-containing protein n=1 Tax=Schistocephalus solidus TaxID=70667 RepID=A0A183SB09_SCHSO|nr:unnamed protein product [Schistocephalus solidus]
MSHYGSVLPEMHRLGHPMNELLRKDVKWIWSREFQQAFEEVKTMLSSDLLFTHFNPNRKLVVTMDASNYGIGTLISHVFPDNTEKAICHAARSLTSAERTYRQIEKETLTIIFVTKKFHKMLYGRQFTLLTDYKSLLSIFSSKNVFLCTRKIVFSDGLTMLLGYDVDIRYQSTTNIGQADAL